MFTEERRFTNKLTVGATHTQYTADWWNDQNAVGRAKNVLKITAPFQAQHIMGFGVDNPWPSKNGPKNFDGLDSRIELIRSTGAVPVITLCAAPDWMKGGADGTTDWGEIETAPLPEHFDDFAELSRVVAERYPDVLYYNVWNELKGFWNSSKNRWDIEGYTDLYNKIYNVLKSVNRNIQVGGPYPSVSSYLNRNGMSDPSNLTGEWGIADQRDLDALQYFKNNADGFDYITVDGGSQPRDGEVLDPFVGAGKFADLTTWIKENIGDKPISWTEFYSYAGHQQFSGNGEIDPPQNFTLGATAILVGLAEAGASWAFHWDAQSPDDFPDQGLFTNTATNSGGQPTPYARVSQWFARELPAGTETIKYVDGDITAYTGKHSALIINNSGGDVTVTVPGYKEATVPAYGVYAPTGPTEEVRPEPEPPEPPTSSDANVYIYIIVKTDSGEIVEGPIVKKV